MGILYGICIVILVVLLLPISFCITANNPEGLCVDSNISYGQGLVSYVFKRRGRDNKAFVKVLGLSVHNFSPRFDSSGSRQTDTIAELIPKLKARKKQLAYFPGIIRDTINSIIGRRSSIVLKLGFEDPAYTGMAAGLISCIFSYYPRALQYTPDFTGENFEVDLYFKGAIIPIVLVFIGFKYGIIYVKEEVFNRNNVKGGKRYGFNG